MAHIVAQRRAVACKVEARNGERGSACACRAGNPQVMADKMSTAQKDVLVVIGRCHPEEASIFSPRRGDCLRPGDAAAGQNHDISRAGRIVTRVGDHRQALVQSPRSSDPPTVDVSRDVADYPWSSLILDMARGGAMRCRLLHCWPRADAARCCRRRAAHFRRSSPRLRKRTAPISRHLCTAPSVISRFAGVR